jgi:hypothetical protein
MAEYCGASRSPYGMGLSGFLAKALGLLVDRECVDQKIGWLLLAS